MQFGNVNVDYAPCKSVGALKAAADYMLGRKREQVESGVRKTSEGLYTALGCNRENFANGILVTRKLNGKSYSKHKDNTILAHKMSISFHPDDNVSYKDAYKIAEDFAEHFIHSKGYEVLFAVHTDTDHVHAHFLISNCNMETGKSYRRSQRDLYEMSEYFGQKCLEHGFTHSVRDSFYNNDMSRQKDKLTFGEAQMKKRGAESFKDELREVIRIEITDPNNHTFDDVIRALWEHYNVECRVAGNTVSYRHPQYLDKNGKPVSVRGSKLGELYTRKGI
ncbi:MAG: relaxase/mobilization nuclease domain-containing protein, partial [Ruminococcus sp.]|nr:relaxase/mobilization nuclease domain-containing protein [Ruminococcus sp.]